MVRLRIMKSISHQKKEIILLLFILLSTIIVVGCSSSYYSDYYDNYKHSYKSEEDKTIFIFNTEKDGETIRWKAVFKDEELVTLYKDGKKISRENLEDYEDIVYDKLSELNPHRQGFRIHVNGMPFDKDKFKRQMERFKNDMEKLKDEKGNLHFNCEEFKEEMKELKERLKELRENDPQFQMNIEKLHKNLGKIAEEFKHQKWADNNCHISIPPINIQIPDMPDDMEINIPEINVDLPEIDLSELNENIDKLNIDMKDIDKEMEKLDDFTKDLKNELLKDNLIKDINEEVKIDISENEMLVNDDKISDSLLAKYKNMYKQHFGKELEKDSHFKLH